MQYKCAAYLRLSDADDKQIDESSSIKSQRLIIDSFANFNKLKIEKTYSDDGFSGGNFDRPAFKEMIKDIENGLINCVITKDLSRLGREMYGTGKYIEQFFLEHEVRYIAINDSYDSLIGDSMLGLRLSINDLYLRDVSKKVRTSFKAKQQKGDYIGSIPLYGYKKNPLNKHQLIVDEEVREVIEYIYDLAMDGTSPTKIADILTSRKIPIPIVYKNDVRSKTVTDNDGFGIWKRQTIKAILTNQMYIGNMVQNTYNKISYNSKKIRKTREEELIIVKNTHEAIITPEKFNEVQIILKNKSTEKRTNGQSEYLFGGLLFCYECGRSIRISKHINKSSIKHYTQCNLYTRKGKYGQCSSHKLNYDFLEEDIIHYLKKLCNKFCEEYNITELKDNSSKILIEKLKDIENDILKKEIIKNKFNSNIDKLYEDRLNEIIDEDTFKRIFKKNKNELDKINKDLEILNNNKISNENKMVGNENFENCKNTVLSYLSLKTPTKKQIEKLVKRIEIDKENNINVYLAFNHIK